MFIIMLIRWFCGWVEFSACGGFPERFVNLCSKAEIPLWDMVSKGGKITASTDAAAYKRIVKPAVKSGMSLKLHKRHGLPFFIRKYRKRSGVVCGFAAFLIILSVLSNMIWSIEITGNKLVSDEEILGVLARAGLKTGCLSDSIAPREIRLYALSELSGVSYIAVNVIGATAQIEVTERVEEPKLIASSVPCDVVAAEDGQLAIIEGYRGTKLKERGDAVLEGEILVSGIVELKGGGNRFLHAEGYAVIRSEKKLKAVVAAESPCLAIEKTAKRISPVFFGFTLPTLPFFGEDNNTEKSESTHLLEIGGVRLPFGYKLEAHRSYKEKERRLTENELALMAAEGYFVSQRNLLEDAVALSESFDVKKTADATEITGRLLVERSGGIAKEMLLEEQISESY